MRASFAHSPSPLGRHATVGRCRLSPPPCRCGSQLEVLNQHLLLTAKPVIYLLNLSEKDYVRKKNKWYAARARRNLVG